MDKTRGLPRNRGVSVFLGDDSDRCPVCGAEIDILDKAQTGYCYDCDVSGRTHEHSKRRLRDGEGG